MKIKSSWRWRQSMPSLRKSRGKPQVTELYALPGNGGIAKDATCVDIAAKDVEGVVAFAKEKGH